MRCRLKSRSSKLMKIGHCYARSDVCKEPGFKDELDRFIVVSCMSSGCYIVMNADGREVNTTNLAFNEKDFDEIDVEEFMHEYGFRMRNLANKQMLAILSAQKEAVLHSGLSAEEASDVAKACMDPIGHIKKYSEEHPEFMEGKLLSSE